MMMKQLPLERLKSRDDASIFYQMCQQILCWYSVYGEVHRLLTVVVAVFVAVLGCRVGGDGG